MSQSSSGCAYVRCAATTSASLIVGEIVCGPVHSTRTDGGTSCAKRCLYGEVAVPVYSVDAAGLAGDVVEEQRESADARVVQSLAFRGHRC
nr:hypothetical protein [Fodinicola acaciae]